MNDTFLLYGANGYTGELIARRAKGLGLSPVLAGRTASKVEPLAEELGFECRVFPLDTPDQIADNLQGVKAVLHAAGPFIHTAGPMMKACLQQQVHYLDITGEIPVFEMAAAYGPKAAKAGIMIMPGTGFDVVPTDCMALFLKQQLPDATHLQLAFATRGSRFSRGTALTMAESLGEGGAMRKNGKIIRQPLGHATMTVDFADDFSRFVMAIPWGDVSTAYYTTGIPNVETFTAVHPKTHRYVKLQKYFNWLLRLPFVRNMAKKRVKSGPAGPSAQQRKEGRSLVWGKVWNAKGEERRARSEMPEGYGLTAATSLIVMQKVLAGQAPAGFQTPAAAYGHGLILEVEGASREILSGDAV
jgi:short subunit dehydrogenase-like uncharacterized protein